MARAKRRFVDVPVIDVITVMFASLNTLLLAFFICLNALAQVDPARTRLALGSLLGSFGRVPSGSPTPGALGMLSSPNIEITGEEMDQMTQALASLLGDQDLEGDLDVYLRDRDLVIRVQGQALFAEGSDELLPGAEVVLQEIGEMIRRTDRRVVIEGHTDADSTVRSQYGTPWMFAAARAARVHDALLDAGLPPARLSVASHGRTRPHVPNESDHQRALNRRIEIVIEEGATDPALRPRTRTVTVGGIDVEVRNPLPAGASGEVAAQATAEER